MREEYFEIAVFACVVAAVVAAENLRKLTLPAVFRFNRRKGNVGAGFDQVEQALGLNTFAGAKHDGAVAGAGLAVGIGAVGKEEIANFFAHRPSIGIAVPRGAS